MYEEMEMEIENTGSTASVDQAIPLASDVVSAWLTARGFQLQGKDKGALGAGYFIKPTLNPGSKRAVVMYRPDIPTLRKTSQIPPEKFKEEFPETLKQMSHDKTHDVALVLHGMGSRWSVTTNGYGYYMLTVEVTDALRDDLARLTGKPYSE